MRHRMKRLRWPVLAVAAVLVAGSGTAYAVTVDGSAGNYRTVLATKGDVEQVLSTSGTVDAARRADLEFATSGTVASVKVAVGDTVKAGQVIATLDTDSLQAAVTRAKAGVARAIAQLESDKESQNDTVADAASSDQTTTPKSNSTPGASGDTGSDSGGVDPATAATLKALKEQQDAVIEAQSAASAAIAAAKEALAAQTEACADAYQDQTTATGSTQDDAGPEPADGNTAKPADNAACSAALAEVQARQDDVSDAQDALAKALSTLAATLTQALETLASPSGGSDTPSSGGSDTPSSDTPSSDTPSSDTPSSDGSDPTSGTSSAAQLAADQAAIEQARADLVDAKQQLGQAVLRSTRSGKVVSLDVAKGDEVSAGDAAAVVVGGRAVTIEATVAESKIGQVEVGQVVRVTTPGESDDAEGTVTAIGLVADSSSGTASYSVTITVEDPAIALPAGSQAMLAIVVATAKDAITVPTSAITRRGDGAMVQLWDGDQLSRKSVTIGTVGAREVEITEGLDVGDEVVLADIDEAITGASDSIDDRGGFGNAPAFRMDKAGPGGGPPVTFKSGG
jgi:HlyD family secretion protein